MRDLNFLDMSKDWHRPLVLAEMTRIQEILKALYMMQFMRGRTIKDRMMAAYRDLDWRSLDFSWDTANFEYTAERITTKLVGEYDVLRKKVDASRPSLFLHYTRDARAA